jgi:hypothetical protein
MSKLNNKVALITGASRGIGKAIAMRFAAEGAKVVVCASRLGEHGQLKGTLQEVVATIESMGGQAAAIACDLTNAEARSDLIARSEAFFGPIDIVVNNAAGSKMMLPSKVSASDRSWMFDLNVNAPIDLAQQVLPGMCERGSGWILNISSATALQSQVPYPDSAMAAHITGPYGATKAALDRFTEALAHEVAGQGVQINTLAPEAIVLTSGAEYVRDIARRRPDMLEPVEMMAEAALALCSHSLTGQICYSRKILHSLGQPLHSLDGREVIGDACTLGDPEAAGF